VSDSAGAAPYPGDLIAGSGIWYSRFGLDRLCADNLPSDGLATMAGANEC
jgi:hypothetical protein